MRGPFPLESALEIAIQTAEGLVCAHGEGLIHRDIKPGNLLIDRKGTVKILDLGLARAVSELEVRAADDPDGLTRSGQVLGTCHYMAPEQALSARLADERSDIYSLGCTLYCLLTAKTPYGGESLVETLLAHRENPIPSLLAVRPDLPPQLERIFRKMLAKSPTDRQQTMAEVVHELKQCRQPASSEVAPIGQLLPASGDEIVVPPEESDHSTTRNIPLAKDTMQRRPAACRSTTMTRRRADPRGSPSRSVCWPARGWSRCCWSLCWPGGSGDRMLASRRSVQDRPLFRHLAKSPLAAGWSDLLAMSNPQVDAVAGLWQFEGEHLCVPGGPPAGSSSRSSPPAAITCGSSSPAREAASCACCFPSKVIRPASGCADRTAAAVGGLDLATETDVAPKFAPPARSPKRRTSWPSPSCSKAAASRSRPRSTGRFSFPGKARPRASPGPKPGS